MGSAHPFSSMLAQALRDRRSNWQTGLLIDLVMPSKYSGKNVNPDTDIAFDCWPAQMEVSSSRSKYRNIFGVAEASKGIIGHDRHTG